MTRWLPRTLAVAAVTTAAFVAYAVGNGDVVATPDVTIVTITSPTGTGSGTATLQNTTTSISYNMLIGSDATCDPALSFAVSGSNPVLLSANTSRSVQLNCPARGTPAMRRCRYHATNNSNGTALADFMTVCLYGAGGALAPSSTTLDFGTVTVGDSAMQSLTLTNNGTQPVTRVYLQTADLAGNFQFSTPCNPDAPYCDTDVAQVGVGSAVTLQIKCTPQTAGTHSAQLYVGTNTYQLLAQPVTLQCIGSAAAAPVLGVDPTNIDIQSGVEVGSGSANVTVHLTNAGGGTLLLNDVRIVDVDNGASTDWSYTASGECIGQITSACSLEAGELVDINLHFDPSSIGRRRATLLVSYRDTIDRTREITLDATGLGATLALAGGASQLSFGMVPVGLSSKIDFEIANRGNRDTTAQISPLSGTTPPFTVMPTSAVVAPNVDRTISVTCAPTSTGAFTTTITALAMDAVTTSPVALNATCEGSSLALYSNPTGVNLGELRTAAGPVRRTIQLLSANAPTQLTLTGQPQLESQNPLITLSPLSQATTPATFDVEIDGDTDGSLAATILVTATNGDTLRIPLNARIVTAKYEHAQSVDLGTFCVGQPTTSSNVALANSGTATISLMPPLLGGGSPFQIELTAPSAYPATLVPGTAATVAITPQRQMAVADLADTLTWRTDVENAQIAETSLSAKFIDQGGAIAPSALEFGDVVVHLYSETGKRVVIQNCNPTPLALFPPVIKSPFQIDSPNFPAMLNPNETATFSVGFHPTRIGLVTDTLRITSPQLPNAPLEVALSGNGVTMPVMPDAGGGSNNPGNTSFYACSCKSSRPGGLVPILIAIMCVLFARRRPRRIGYPSR